jgi:hypothetical protein
MPKRSAPRNSQSIIHHDKENISTSTANFKPKSPISLNKKFKQKYNKGLAINVASSPKKVANLKKKSKKNKKIKKIDLVIPIKLQKSNKKSPEVIKNRKKKVPKLKPKKRLIELEEINNKFLASYTNFDYLLSILEVVNNKEYYELNYSDRSKCFWQKVISIKQCDKIFAGFKPETLRKYWGLINKHGNLDKISKAIFLIKGNENASKIKLKTLVDWLSSLYKDGAENVELESSLEDLITKENKSKDSKEKEILKKQRKPPVELKKTETKVSKTSEEPVNTKKRVYRFVIDEDDKEEREKFLCINEAIETFKSIFKHKKYSESFILDALNINSFNLESTFNYLLNPNGNSKIYVKLDKCFNNTEDYTIQNMRESHHYQSLLEKKGEENLKEREAYLSN